MVSRAVGPHLVSCESITSFEVDKLFDDGRLADIFYCDPPWGEGAMKMFATMAEKKGETVQRETYDVLEARMFQLAKNYAKDHVFIETGLRWEDRVIDGMKQIGLTGIETVRIVYGGKDLGNVLLHGSLSGTLVDLDRVQGMKGGKVSVEVIRPVAVPGGILFDPCCGLGYSAKAALAYGMNFRGNELSQARLNKTIKALSQ